MERTALCWQVLAVGCCLACARAAIHPYRNDYFYQVPAFAATCRAAARACSSLWAPCLQIGRQQPAYILMGGQEGLYASADKVGLFPERLQGHELRPAATPRSPASSCHRKPATGTSTASQQMPGTGTVQLSAAAPGDRHACAQAVTTWNHWDVTGSGLREGKSEVNLEQLEFRRPSDEAAKHRVNEGITGVVQVLPT